MTSDTFDVTDRAAPGSVRCRRAKLSRGGASRRA